MVLIISILIIIVIVIVLAIVSNNTINNSGNDSQALLWMVGQLGLKGAQGPPCHLLGSGQGLGLRMQVSSLCCKFGL